MLSFWKEKLVLLAVPKTGTTALEQILAPRASLAILGPPALKHVSARGYRREIAPWLTRGGTHPHELVAVIREPVDWLESWYRYRHRPEIAGHANSTQGIEFEAFVRAWMAEEPPAYARVGSQARFLSSKGGRLLVDHLFRYEAPERIMAFLNQRLGDLPELPRVNVSPKLDVQLSAELAAELRDYAARDIALWTAARA